MSTGVPPTRRGSTRRPCTATTPPAFLGNRLSTATPVYLQVNFVAPHSGLPRDPDDPPNSGGLSTPYVDPPFRGEYRGPTLPDSAAYDEPDITDKPALGDLPRITRSVANRIKRATQQRRDSLLAADIQIKRIIDLVTALGHADNTLFVFLSDNGYFSGEHRITRGKNSHYEPAAHVPLVVRGPGFAPGTVNDHLTGVHDVAPTVLAAAGASAGAGHVFDGRPLQEIPTPDGRAILLEIGDGEGGFVVRGVVSPDRWKYVEIRGGFVEMYDLTTDPYERFNRAAEPRHADKRAELAELLRQLTAGEERAGSR